MASAPPPRSTLGETLSMDQVPVKHSNTLLLLTALSTSPANFLVKTKRVVSGRRLRLLQMKSTVSIPNTVQELQQSPEKTRTRITNPDQETAKNCLQSLSSWLYTALSLPQINLPPPTTPSWTLKTPPKYVFFPNPQSHIPNRERSTPQPHRQLDFFCPRYWSWGRRAWNSHLSLPTTLSGPDPSTGGSGLISSVPPKPNQQPSSCHSPKTAEP
ncbi:PREDICTED: uncharacterized protein LOC102029520 [Chinchilla lanigera]|uniref:uncharacterized protein LOC102029520 n=1 Tax=Chinchilla lanigera TaxID=34839 RepID=UPI00038EEC9C|nr:PREDICTED: uncharacterized protein LOC102029520 [Chinchilla lanigera]